MLLAWRSHAMLLVLSVHSVHGSSDRRLSLPTDPVSDPTPVWLMAGGANQVCLRPDRPAVDSWLRGPQCFHNVNDKLGLESEASFVAVLDPNAFGIPADIGAAAEAPPIPVGKSRDHPLDLVAAAGEQRRVRDGGRLGLARGCEESG